MSKELKRLSEDVIQIHEKSCLCRNGNINVYEEDDLISEIFWGSTSEVLKEILVPDIFSNSQDDVSRKAHDYLKAFWAPMDGCFWRFRQ